MKNIAKNVIKPENMRISTNATRLLKIDEHKIKNYLAIKDMDISFAAQIFSAKAKKN